MASDAQMEWAMAIVRDAGHVVIPDIEFIRVMLDRCGCVECRRHLAAEVVAGLIAAGYKVEREPSFGLGHH